MCGIFGLAVAAGHGFDRAEWDRAIRRLFLLSESRGKEAAGIAVATAEKIVVHKDSVSASQMLKTKDYDRAIANALNGHFGGAKPGAGGDDFVAAIGHCRLVTNGLQGIDANNQPVRRDDAVIIHNGIVVNVDDIWARQNAIRPAADVDTEVIAALVE
jgi:glutamine phosphoribosylpyrophosphate amidotransferase